MEYRLANGGTLTDEDIERERAELEGGEWEGHLTRLRVGRPRLVPEGNANLSFKCPRRAADLISRAAEAAGMKKSEFMRAVAIEKAEEVLSRAS